MDSPSPPILILQQHPTPQPGHPVVKAPSRQLFSLQNFGILLNSPLFSHLEYSPLTNLQLYLQNISAEPNTSPLFESWPLTWLLQYIPHWPLCSHPCFCSVTSQYRNQQGPLTNWVLWTRNMGSFIFSPSSTFSTVNQSISIPSHLLNTLCICLSTSFFLPCHHPISESSITTSGLVSVPSILPCSEWFST